MEGISKEQTIWADGAWRPQSAYSVPIFPCLILILLASPKAIFAMQTGFPVRQEAPKGQDAVSQGSATRPESKEGDPLKDPQNRNDFLWAARNWSFVGNQALSRGDLATAEDCYQQALAMREKLAPGSLDVAESFNDLGNVAYSRGDLARAAGYYQRALAIRENLVPTSIDAATSLNSLGLIAGSRGDLANAERYYKRALAIRERLAPGSLDVANSLNNLGTIAQSRGQLAKAVAYYERALAIQRELAPASLEAAWSFSNLGAIEGFRGDLAKAEDYYKRALVIRQKLAPGTLALFQVQRDLAELFRRQGQLSVAAQYFNRSLDALDHQATRFGGADDDRAGFLARNADVYRSFIDTLLDPRMGRKEQAFEVLERSRARLLLNMLAERDVVFSADIPLGAQRIRNLNAAEYDRIQARLSKLDSDKDQKQVELLIASLGEFNTERERMIEQIRKDSPRFAALQYPQPLDLESTRGTLDTGTVLLSYSVGQYNTLLFVVRPKNMTSGLSVFKLPVGATALQEKVKGFRNIISRRNTPTERNLAAQARELYDLLIRPSESLLTPSDRLLITPDGPLDAMPFAALMRDNNEYLIEWKPLHTVVSATVYSELKKMRRDRSSTRIQFAGFGDPRYPDEKETSIGFSDKELRSVFERGVRFARLPFSRFEVDSIAALYPGRSQEYLGVEATEEHAKAVGKDVRYLHFATHAVLDERVPLNSGLALTIPDKLIEGQDNGLLQAWEIFDRVRLDADLVTLSACNTGLGKEMGGEGLLGLTRAFQYAGAQSVLASLWSVDDSRTAEFMTRFYTQLQRGQTKDEALRASQLQMIRSRSSSHPFYWAAFTLSGDWR